MRRLIEKIVKLSADEGFFRFQNDLARTVYDALGQGYSAGEGEVPMVKRMVEAINGRTYDGIHIHSTILHGSRSYVEFSFMDKPVTKELGDMAVIALVTDGPQRLLQKTCIIQNKKDAGPTWGVDPEQLYLLKNFPTFSGNKGIFRGCHDVTFRNSSGCLGAYGLFHAPGEMILASAPLVTEILRGRHTLPGSELAVFPQGIGSRWGSPTSAFPWWLACGRHPKEFFYMFEEMMHMNGFPFGLTDAGNGFLGNVHFARDLYDFARDWTQVSIGETSLLNGQIVNAGVDSFSNLLLRRAAFRGLGDDLPTSNAFGDVPFEGQIALMVMHMNVGEKQ